MTSGEIATVIRFLFAGVLLIGAFLRPVQRALSSITGPEAGAHLP
jgi:hypothetical protein